MPAEMKPGKRAATGLSAELIRILADVAFFPDGGLTPLIIVGLLNHKGLTPETLAEKHGCHNAFIYQVINRTRKTNAIRTLIASAIELDYEIVWESPTHETQRTA